jgi:hypothetical protein
MKTAAKTVALILWLALAALQLLFSPQVASAKSSLSLENHIWKIFSSAAQTHQANRPISRNSLKRNGKEPLRSAAPHRAILLAQRQLLAFLAAYLRIIRIRGAL